MRLINNDRFFQNMEEDAYDMIATCSSIKELLSIKTFHRKDGKINMCQAIKELLADERRIGLEEGIERGIERGMEQTLMLIIRKKIRKNLSLDMIADDLEEDIEVIRPIYEVVKKQMKNE